MAAQSRDNIVEPSESPSDTELDPLPSPVHHHQTEPKTRDIAGGLAPFRADSDNCLAVFAKRPVAGEVKTRLAGARSAEWAARLAEAFLLDTLNRMASVIGRRLLVYAPSEARGYFEQVAASQYELLAQGDGTLGNRLATLFAQVFLFGARKVVAIGTDSPNLPCEFVQQAFGALERCDVVLGPAMDGGYYLIGLGKNLPGVFENICWSSSKVLEQTIAALRSTPHTLEILPPWYDIDTLDDWNMLRGHIAAQRHARLDPGVPRTERLLLEDLP